jgi:hypothetical protein
MLNRSEIDHFIERGWVALRRAFPLAVASEICARIWSEMGLHPEKPEQWSQPFVHIRRNFQGQPFNQAFTPRVISAFDALMGAGRWKRNFVLGWWPILFPGFAKGPWRPPTDGWHVDGSFFHHRLYSAEQGLLPIFLFSNVEPGDGGTALAEGSHTITANILAEAEPRGVAMDELSRRVLAHPRALKCVIEAHGNAGDVILIHPFLLHASSANTGRQVRIACNPCFSMLQPMDLSDRAASPVEIAIRRAISKNVVLGS